MKLTRLELDTLNNRLSTENEVLTLALADICNGGVKWFGYTRTFSLGISRPNGAAGGIAIVRESGMVNAHYWESYSRETLENISRLITGTDTESNREYLRRRSAIEAAQAYVSEQQRAAKPQIHDQMKTNAPKEALTRAVNRAIAEGSPVFIEMKTQHTPGPWHFQSCTALDGIGHAYEIEVDGFTIALVHPCDEMDANARLIAAAPELLNLVLNILPQAVKINGDESQWVKDARAAIAAIAKATA